MAARETQPVIHIFRAEMPQMMSDILREIASATPDVDGVDQVETSDDLLASVDETSSDLVIAGSRGGKLPWPCKALMQKLPGLAVLAVSTEGRRGWLYREPSAFVPLPELTPIAVRTVVSTELSARQRARTRNHLG
jgi:hypothetical protein